MIEKKYKARLLDTHVDDCLQVAGAVCIEGPKWCGKTWTSEYHSKSSIFIGDPAGGYQNRELAIMSPDLVLEGEKPRLIDEWQEVPPLWDAVRSTVDKSQEKGQYILTGSATPNKKGKLHSGAGRIVKIRMRPMTLYESGDSSGRVSLYEICKGNSKNQLTGEVKLKDLIYYIVRGGWPGNLGVDEEKAQILPTAYINAVIEEDLERIDEGRHDASKMEKLLRSLARNEGTTATNNTLRRDIQDMEGNSIDSKTVSEYLNAFSRLFLIDDQPAFAVNIQSSKKIKQQAKRHLADPSLAAALLEADTVALLNDLNTLGFLFEALCERDLRIYAETFGGKISHYQDYANREIDTVIEMPDNKWVAVEIKLGAHQIEEAAKNLLKISEEMKTVSKENAPEALIVVCGMSNAAYMRDDGVYVVPITALAP